MIISPRRNFIFVHIPKTGGSSMAIALESRAMADDMLIGDTPKARRRRGRLAGLSARGRLWKHSTLADIDGLLSPAEIAGMFTFTLVRNPWDRLVSYYHWLRVQAFDHPAVLLAKARDFSGFLNATETQAALRAQPVRHYMTDIAGQDQGRLHIRLEYLDEDAEPLWQHLGFKLDLPRVNTSLRPQGDYRAAYTERDAALVARICKEDVARFGYRF